MQGLDLSFYQRETYKNFIDNYAKDFVIVRATFGRYVDEYCDKIYQYAKSKGKKLGFYMFPLTSEGSPEGLPSGIMLKSLAILVKLSRV